MGHLENQRVLAIVAAAFPTKGSFSVAQFYSDLSRTVQGRIPGQYEVGCRRSDISYDTSPGL